MRNLYFCVFISVLLFSLPVWSVQKLSEESSLDDFLDAPLNDLLSFEITNESRRQ